MYTFNVVSTFTCPMSCAITLPGTPLSCDHDKYPTAAHFEQGGDLVHRQQLMQRVAGALAPVAVHTERRVCFLRPTHTECRHRRDAQHVRWPLRDNSLPHRIEHDLGRVVQIELLHQIRPMGLDGRQPQIELGGHLFVGASFGEQLEHFLLAVR